ncbi:MAG: hypothetical protein AB1374_05855 [Bacillota bacterium]
MKFSARRPRFCVITKCRPVAVHGCAVKGHAPGESGFCIGKMTKAEVWTAETVEHVNDICFCVYTPFKGWVRFVVNEADLRIITALIRNFARKTGVNLPELVVLKEE